MRRQMTGENHLWALFDLDETLYPKGSGVMEAVRDRIDSYMMERLGLDEETVRVLRPRYRQEYGTALAGLLVDYQVDAEDYLSYVHDVPLEEYLSVNRVLDQALGQVPWRKAVFTSSTRMHADRVLAALGITHHFERIYDVSNTGYVGKPYPQAYQAVVQALQVCASDCIMIEDHLPNLRAPRELGMITVLVGATALADGVDFVIDRVEDIVQVATALERRRVDLGPTIASPCGGR